MTKICVDVRQVDNDKIQKKSEPREKIINSKRLICINTNDCDGSHVIAYNLSAFFFGLFFLLPPRSTSSGRFIQMIEILDHLIEGNSPILVVVANASQGLGAGRGDAVLLHQSSGTSS